MPRLEEEGKLAAEIKGRDNVAAHFRPSSCCQHLLSISGLVAGIFITLSGVFAFCATKGILPPNATPLKKFSVIDLKNSYFVIGGGSALTLLSAAAIIHLFKKDGEMQTHAAKN